MICSLFGTIIHRKYSTEIFEKIFQKTYMISKYFSLFQVFTDKSKKKQPSAKGTKRKHSAMGGESAKKSKK